MMKPILALRLATRDYRETEADSADARKSRTFSRKLTSGVREDHLGIPERHTPLQSRF